MGRPPVKALVIVMLLGISGCAGAPQRLSWTSSPAPSADRPDSPSKARYSWWNRPRSQPGDATDRRPDLAQSNAARSTPKEKSSTLDLWQDQHTTGLTRFFPSWNRRWGSTDDRRDRVESRSVAAKRSDRESDAADRGELHASRPATRFRDVLPVGKEDTPTFPLANFPARAPSVASWNEGAVLRASLPPQEFSSGFTQAIGTVQVPGLETGSGNLTQTSRVPTLQPALVPPLSAMFATGEPDSLLPQSLMRDSEDGSDSHPVSKPKPAQNQTLSGKASSATAPKQKQKRAPLPATSPRPQSPTPPIPAASIPPPPAEPTRLTAATKPASDETTLQFPVLEPAAPMQPVISFNQSKPEAAKSASPPPVPSPAPEPKPPSTSSAALQQPKPPSSSPAPPSSSSSPASSSAMPASSGAAGSGAVPLGAGDGQLLEAQSTQREFLTWPNFDGSLKTLPSAQFSAPLFPTTYDCPMPTPQTSCAPYPARIKKCDWTPGKYTMLLIRKLKCLKQYIHDHCPLKKKFAKSCCQNCNCCAPSYIGTMASPQGFFGSLQSPPMSFSSDPTPLTPQVSQLMSPLNFGGSLSPDSRVALDASAGAKPGDIPQGGEELMPIAPQSFNKTP